MGDEVVGDGGNCVITAEALVYRGLRLRHQLRRGHESRRDRGEGHQGEIEKRCQLFHSCLLNRVITAYSEEVREGGAVGLVEINWAGIARGDFPRLARKERARTWGTVMWLRSFAPLLRGRGRPRHTVERWVEAELPAW